MLETPEEAASPRNANVAWKLRRDCERRARPQKSPTVKGKSVLERSGRENDRLPSAYGSDDGAEYLRLDAFRFERLFAVFTAPGVARPSSTGNFNQIWQSIRPGLLILPKSLQV